MRICPNPFRGKTTIGFSVSGIGYSQKSEKLHPTPCTLYPVSLKVYDIAGRMVRTLIDGEVGKGHHSIEWDGKDDKGMRLSSGIYFYRLTAGGFKKTLKLTLLN